MLTLFVGTLTDYFRAGFPAEERPPREPLEARVTSWRDYISGGLVGNGHLASPLAWDESPQEAFTHVLTVEALQALRLLLVHGDGCDAPPTELPQDYSRHPRWTEAAADNFESCGAFDQVLVPELWLPNAEFDFTFECPYPDGHEAHAGSVSALKRQLHEVGRSKLPGTPEQRNAWRADVPQGTRDLLELARFAYAAFETATDESERRGLPVLLHW